MSQRSVAPGFQYADRALSCDGVPLTAIAAEVGTPAYVYSAATIRSAYRAFTCAFATYPHALHYALKANSTLAIARLLRECGAGADANSGGEIELALRAGFTPEQIVFTGVGKTRAEIDRAVSLGVKAINAESAGELARIDEAARARGTRANVALRVNPDIDAESHPHISTGLSRNKFGLPAGDAVAVLRDAAGRDGLQVVGIHVHVGSQITKLEPLRRAAELAVSLAGELRRAGITLEHLDLGGGLGISYDGVPVPAVQEYAAALLEVLRPWGVPLIVEPGRAIVGPAGVLLGRVVDVKARPGDRHFVVLDTGMTELIRPALYSAFHRILPVSETDARRVSCDIVGPLCETSDMLGADRHLPLPAIDSVMAVMDAGAYGAAMASNYNRRLLPPEVLVEDGAWRVIRRRQTIDDMLALERA
ncbi:MAG TPA: diaminopimelate decarboxylase [Vicinamibacterales bacterium]|nr:diaminopimelate decarboxylase [Vicinamibacterales bacterium]